MAVIREDNKGGYRVLAVESAEALPVMTLEDLKKELAGAERYAENLHHEILIYEQRIMSYVIMSKNYRNN